MNGGQKIYVLPSDVHCGDHGILVGPTEKAVYLDTEITTKVTKKNDNYGFPCKQSVFHGQPDVADFTDVDSFVFLNSESIEVSSDEDLYQSEDLQNIDRELFNIQQNIADLTQTKEGIEASGATVLRQINFFFYSKEVQDELQQIQKSLADDQKGLSERKSDLLKKAIGGGSTLLERAIDQLEQQGKFQLSDDFGFTVQDGFADNDTSSSSSTALAAINYLFEKESTILTTSSIYKDQVEHGEEKNLELNENSALFQLNSLYLQLASYESEYSRIIAALDASLTNLAQLQKQKEAIVAQQKKKVNDIIVDKSGTTLGFDGFGRLVLIQDKFENKIEIEFGFDGEDEGKMLAVFSDDQRLEFHYDKTSGLLSSLIDPQGRKTRFAYDGDQLIAIQYSDQKKTAFDYTYGFKVASPLLETLSLNQDDKGWISIRTYCYDGKISKKEVVLDPLKTKNLSDELFIFNESDHLTIARDKKRNNDSSAEPTFEDTVYHFDTAGRIIKCQNKDVTAVNFYEGQNLASEVLYQSDEAKSILDYLTIHDGPCSYQIDLTKYANLPSSNMLGLKIDVLTGNVDNEAILTFNVKATVHSHTTSGVEKTEIFEQTYQEIKRQTLVLPIVIDRRYSEKIDIAITSESADFTGTYFAAVDLIALEKGVFYAYDAKGRLVEKNDGNTVIYYADYNEEDIPLTAVQTNIYGEKITTRSSYDANNQLTCLEDSQGNVTEYAYNAQGQCVLKRSYNKKDASLARVEKYRYDEHGSQISSDGSIKRPDGSYPSEKVSYLDTTDEVSSIQKADGSKTSYTYDFHSGDLLSISSDVCGLNNATSFGYTFGLLTSLSHHGVHIDYEYDGQGRKTSIALNGVPTIWNTYNDDYFSKNDANYTFADEIKHGSYADSTTVDGLFMATYSDDRDQIRYSSYSADDSFGTTTCEYDEDRIKKVTSTMTDRKTEQSYQEISQNTYDELKQLTKQEKMVNGISKLILEDHYDEDSRYVDSSDVILSEDEYRLNYQNSYNQDHQLSAVSVREGIVGDEEFFTEMAKVEFDYDVLNRVTHESVKTDKMSLCHEYAYLQQDENTLDMIAEDIAKIKITDGNNIAYLSEISSYTYDVSGNITQIVTDDEEMRYAYDQLNRLIREDNPALNQSIVYKYDRAGNILLKKIYPYSLSENLFTPQVKEYIYDCEETRDCLISFDGQSIAYDNMGRPTTYKDDEFGWNNQGQLTDILTQNMDEITYLYDTNGVRRQKIVNGVETSFITNGTQILAMKQKNKTLIFRYVLNKLIGFNYNDGSSTNEYLYHRNIQGDIIGIYDDQGDKIGGYAYDAYGNHVITEDQDGIASLNPFRYRGYFCDEETKLYYLNSRYYDPETGRFISPDTLSILDETRGQINGLNLYMYCGDNPVMRVDPSGMAWWEWLLAGLAVTGLIVGTIFLGGVLGAAFLGAAIGGGISLVTQAIGGELSWGQFALDIGVGALTGVIGASGISRLSSMLVGGLIGAGSNFASQLIGGRSIGEINWLSVGISGAVGSLAGLIGGAGAKNAKKMSQSIAKNPGVIKANAASVKVANKILSNSYPTAVGAKIATSRVTNALAKATIKAAAMYGKKAIIWALGSYGISSIVLSGLSFIPGW